MSAAELALDGDDLSGAPVSAKRPAATGQTWKGARAARDAEGAKAPVRSAARARLWTARWHRVLRIGVQVVFFVLAPGLFAAAFNGVKYLFGQIGALESFQMTSFVVVLAALLAFTIVFGRFFCGYACAFGALGDWVHTVVRGVLARTPLRNVGIPEGAMKVLSLVKYFLLAAIAAACVLGVWADVSGLSPWVAFAGFTSGSLEGIRKGAFVLLGLCVVGMALSERFFCRVLCPMGAVFALMPVLGISSFTRTPSHCVGHCGKCREACPVGLWPDADALSHGECLACGRCADACPLGNVNLVAVPKKEGRATMEKTLAKVGAQAERAVEAAASSDAGAAPLSPHREAVLRKKAFRSAWGTGRPVRKTRTGWLAVRGSGTGVVLLRAALLLALCWAVGVTRYLPPFGEVIAAVPWPF